MLFVTTHPIPAHYHSIHDCLGVERLACFPKNKSCPIYLRPALFVSRACRVTIEKRRLMLKFTDKEVFYLTKIPELLSHAVDFSSYFPQQSNRLFLVHFHTLLQRPPI